MAESPRGSDPHAPQNPPQSVVNRGVRRSALWSYLGPLLLFFAGIGIALLYWAGSPPRVQRDTVKPRAEGTATGTTGTERERGREATPGGGSPDSIPAGPSQEITQRTGETLSELGAIFDDNSRDVIGKRIEVQDVDVERVESPTLFWVRDGIVRAAVVAPALVPAVRVGQTVNVIGTVERSSGTVRIRASRVEPSR